MRPLTDRKLRSLKPAAAGKRYDIRDEVRGLAIRVNDEGRKSFVLIARFPGSSNPTRRALGEYPTMTLERARSEARKWHQWLREGKDPASEIERSKLAEARRQEDSFTNVAEAYFAHIQRKNLRRAGEVEREIRREFVSRWAKRPITDIDRHDVISVVEEALKRGAPYQAHHVLSYASRLFNWAIERGTYGLESSPCDRIRPAKLIGPKLPRTRVLNDAELRALWHVSGRLPYPIGPLVRMLILTGQRRSEVAGMRWREIDLERRLWSIPATRMKAGGAHIVPLTAETIAILEALPRFNKGDYVFSTTFGTKPVNGFSKAKIRLDQEMRAELGSAPENFTLHDIRRTMRTGLSALPIPDLVRELVIGHTKPGLHKVYDQHAYLDEKRHALELWAARLRSIIEPPPANVVKIKKARA
jgi:integrase